MGAIEDDIIQAFKYNFRTKLEAAMRRGFVGATRQMETYIRNLGNQQFGNPVDTTPVFKGIAALMHEELLADYDKLVLGRKVVESYQNRGGTRLPGVIRNVLESPSMVEGNANGIAYINRSLLDAEAKHWRRLNFGAKPSPQLPSKPAPVYFDGRVLFYAGSESQPSAPFQLPVGRWIDPRSGKRVSYGPSKDGGSGTAYSGSPPTVDRFYPGGGGRQFLRPFTRGIQGRHFIDGGFRVLAQEFGPALDGLFRKWGGTAGDGFKPRPTIVPAQALPL